jgi:uncharacterized protein
VPGERDLQKMLSTIGVERRPGTFTYVTGDWPALAAEAAATIVEAEGTTLVVAVEAAVAVGAPIEFRGAWLTLTVFSALEAVGLTAAVARALADEGIPCNVLAGYHHDHMLVPEERAGDAMRVLRRLRSP